MGDELVSLYYSVVNFGFVVCTYQHHWPDNVQAVCTPNATWASPTLASIPAGIRFLQSIRRKLSVLFLCPRFGDTTDQIRVVRTRPTGYHDSDGLRIHALNAAKYSCSIAYYFFYYAVSRTALVAPPRLVQGCFRADRSDVQWRIRGSRDTWLLAMFIFSATVNSAFSFSWDIWMDWGLARRNTKHWMLRAEISGPAWFYYVAVGLDLVLRFAWVQYLPALSRTSGAPSVQLRGFLTALLEVGRRIMWNFLRGEFCLLDALFYGSEAVIADLTALPPPPSPPAPVESEHLGNVDGYRVTRQIPLPYVTLGPASDAASLHDDVAHDAPLPERALAHARNVLSWPGQAARLVRNELGGVLAPRRARRGAGTGEDSDSGGRAGEEDTAPSVKRERGGGHALGKHKGEVAESSTEEETGGSGEEEEDDEAWERVEEGRGGFGFRGDDEEEGEGEGEHEHEHEPIGGMAAVDEHERRTGALG